jgi:hypothetical protein
MTDPKATPTPQAQAGDAGERVRLALEYSRNFANSKPNIGPTEKEHILGLCNLLERVAAEDGPWKQAVIDAAVVSEFWPECGESDPRGFLNSVICWNNEIALDPRVSSAAQALIEQGRATLPQAPARDAGAVAVMIEHPADRKGFSGNAHGSLLFLCPAFNSVRPGDKLYTHPAAASDDARDAAKWRAYVAVKDAGPPTHECRHCRWPYTPRSGESEDCPECGSDGEAYRAALSSPDGLRKGEGK